MVKIYCEHGALIPDLRLLLHGGLVELVHFPYDPGSLSRFLKPSSRPSLAQVQDLNLPISELGDNTVEDFQGSIHFADVLRIVGPGNRRDALHIDSAFKTGCAIFVTQDTDILAQSEQLEALLGIRFFHPYKDKEQLLVFIRAQNVATRQNP